VQRRLAVLLALLATLLVAPSVATAQHPGGHHGPWGGATTTPAPSADDPTGGAGAGDYDDDWDPDGSGGTSDGSDGAWGDGVPVPGAGGATGNGALPGTGGDGGAGQAPTTIPVDPSVLVPVPSARRTVKGKVARIRTDGRAAIPRQAPQAVKRVIAAANLIIGKPYKWGGGHARLVDSGYDCSGAVSYALIRAGLQQGSMVSGTFARWAAGGAGRWISIHANAGHVYMEVAGLRLDTSSVGDRAGRSGVRWRPVIGRRTGFHTRHIVGL
jgi:hypothetical protein